MLKADLQVAKREGIDVSGMLTVLLDALKVWDCD